MYSIFHIEGGLGKHVAATAVAKCIKNNHPDRKLIVICAYPEMYVNLDYVDRVYRHGNTPYFYDDYIRDKDSIIFKHEPYYTTEHIHKTMPLIQNWCKLYNLEYNNEKPTLIFNLRQQQIGFNKWKREKPIMVLQTNGGPMESQEFPYSWTRDLPYNIGQQLVQYYKNKYHIIQICRHDYNALEDVEVVNNNMSNSELFSLLLYSEKNILIDSSLQHAAAALNKPSTVLWIGTSPKVFGYDIHTNIIADINENHKLPDSYFFDYSFNGVTHECPFVDEDIFRLSDIINATDNE